MKNTKILKENKMKLEFDGFKEKCICNWSKNDEYGFISNTKCPVHGKKARGFLKKIVSLRGKK